MKVKSNCQLFEDMMKDKSILTLECGKI